MFGCGSKPRVGFAGPIRTCSRGSADGLERSGRRRPGPPRRKRHAPAFGYQPPYAAIVVDANSGGVLHAANPDALRHPASLTKIMTLYLLFERLEAGKLKLDSPLQVSEHAADQVADQARAAAGQTIEVEDAIKGMVTRSANDAAVVVAENLGGSEDAIRQADDRARRSALGMSHTVYRNASGLPNDDQVTTARDQSILGRAIQERFPRYYKYFSIRSFNFRGQSIGNHNHLLGTRRRRRRHQDRLHARLRLQSRHVGASRQPLCGGRRAGREERRQSRRRMRQLLSDYVADASTKRTAPMIAEAGERPEARPRQGRKPSPKPSRKPSPRRRATRLRDRASRQHRANRLRCRSGSRRPCRGGQRQCQRSDPAGGGEDTAGEAGSRGADRSVGALSLPTLRHCRTAGQVGDAPGGGEAGNSRPSPVAPCRLDP